MEGAPIVHRERPPQPKPVAPEPDCFYKYSGNWNNGVKDGKGVFTLRDYSVYEGDFLNGEITGSGTRTYADGTVYVGGWLDGEKAGYGVETASDGQVYKGTWAGNRREGKGLVTWKNGDCMEGVFSNHKMNGEGRRVKDGCEYEGGFVDGTPDGQGQGTYRDKEGGTLGAYSGSWQQGQRSGQGEFRDANAGIVYAGEFVEDRPASSPCGIMALFDASAQPVAAKKPPPKAAKGKPKPGAAEDRNPELQSAPGGAVPAVMGRCFTELPTESGADGGADSEEKPPTASTTSLAIAPPAALCESGRTLRLTIRTVDAEKKEAFDTSVLEEGFVPTPLVIPDFVNPDNVDFLVRVESAQQVSSNNLRYCGAKTTDNSLLAFYDTNTDSVSGHKLGCEEAEVEGNACATVGESSVSTGSLTFGEEGGSVVVDFYVAQSEGDAPAPAPVEATEGEAAEETEAESLPLFQSDFVTVNLNKGSYFTLTTATSSWNLPPPVTGIAKSTWHSIGVTIPSNGGIPALVYDGRVVSGGSVVEGEDAAAVAGEATNADEEGCASSSKETALTFSAGVTIKNLGVWATSLSADVLTACTNVYSVMRENADACAKTASDAKREFRNKVKERDDKRKEMIEAGEEVGEEEDLGEEPVFVDGCNWARNGYTLSTVGGECKFDNIVMPDTIQPGAYAIVVEDTSDLNDSGLKFFDKLSGGGVVVINIAQ
jgi:hypothetical protein